MKRKMIIFDLNDIQDKRLLDYIELKQGKFSEYVKELIAADVKSAPKRKELTAMQKAFIEYTNSMK